VTAVAIVLTLPGVQGSSPAQVLGFDPGLRKECMWGFNVAVDQTQCPGTYPSGPHWVIGANRGRCAPGGGPDLAVQNINVDPTPRKASIYWGGLDCGVSHPAGWELNKGASLLPLR
jgi:hypothetical protein